MSPKRKKIASANASHENSALVEIARSAAITDSGDASRVGDLVDIEVTEETVTALTFESHLPGYVGWRWAVTIAKVDDGAPTICDVVLLPGPDSILAPEWIPYSNRITSEDVVAGTIVPTSPDDARLVPTNSVLPADEDFDLHELFELGVSRLRVLSIEGRDQAAKRWIEGDRSGADHATGHVEHHCPETRRVERH